MIVLIVFIVVLETGQFHVVLAFLCIENYIRMHAYIG